MITDMIAAKEDEVFEYVHKVIDKKINEIKADIEKLIVVEELIGHSAIREKHSELINSIFVLQNVQGEIVTDRAIRQQKEFEDRKSEYADTGFIYTNDLSASAEHKKELTNRKITEKAYKLNASTGGGSGGGGKVREDTPVDNWSTHIPYIQEES